MIDPSFITASAQPGEALVSIFRNSSSTFGERSSRDLDCLSVRDGAAWAETPTILTTESRVRATRLGLIKSPRDVYRRCSAGFYACRCATAIRFRGAGRINPIRPSLRLATARRPDIPQSGPELPGRTSISILFSHHETKLIQNKHDFCRVSYLFANFVMSAIASRVNRGLV